MQPDLSIILPCYNPTGNWMEWINAQFTRIQTEIPSAQLIIINDGSTNFNVSDLQKFFATNSAVKIVSYTANHGKGYALREGVKSATGKHIIYTDIDFPYTHESFLKIYSSLSVNKSDIAIGIRGAEYYTHLPQSRTRISHLLRFLIKGFLRLPTDDTQCGLKGFNQAGKEIFLQTTINRYLFDLEFLFLAAHKKLKLETIPVQLRPEVQLSVMRWNVLLQEFGNFMKVFVRSIF